MTEEPRLEEQVVSQAVQLGLNNQLDAADELNVDIKTDLLKAVQGQVDSVAVSGQGMRLQNIRMQEVEVQTDRISLNPLAALFGRLELEQPVNAAARVVLTEADLNQLLNAEAVKALIPPLEFTADGEPLVAELQFPFTVSLPGGNRIGFEGAALLRKASGVRSVGFSGLIALGQGGLPVLLEAFQCQPGQGISLATALGLLEKFQALLQQPNLTIAGMEVQIKKVELAAGQVTIESLAQMQEFPSL